MSGAWDDPTGVNHDTNGVFSGTIDPSQMAFNGDPDNFDFGQMQVAPTGMPQHMQNGIQRNGSPAGMQQPPFHTTSVVPSKRPHTDTYTNSPRQPSRSITPSQPQFAGGYPTSNGQPTPNPMQNFNQVNSNTASPSPVMHNQQFNVNGAAAHNRMQTASPSPFSPAATNPGLNMSPAPSDFSAHGGGGGGAGDGGGGGGAAPNGVAGFPQGNNFVNGHNAGSPGFHPQMNAMGQQGMQMNANVVPHSSNMDPMEQQRRLAQMRQASMARTQAGIITTPQRPGAMPPGQPSNPQLAVLQAQHQHKMSQVMSALIRPFPLEMFNQQLGMFNGSKGHAYNPSLNVNGREILPGKFFELVMRQGGSRVVTSRQLWPPTARSLQLEPTPANIQALMAYWQSNLAMFENMTLQNHQMKTTQLKAQYQGMSAQIMSQAQVRQQHQPNMPGAQNPAMIHLRRSSGAESQGHPHMSPQGFTGQPGMFPQGQPPRAMPQNPMAMGMPPQHSLQQPLQPPQPQQQQQHQQQQQPPPPPQQPQQPPPPQQQQQPQPKPPSTRPAAKRMSSAAGLTQEHTLKEREPSAGLVRQLGPQHVDRSDPFVSDQFDFFHHKSTEIWGPLTDDAVIVRTTEALEEVRPHHPHIGEMGCIDIHNINMSLKSGIVGEVRLALDVLCELTRQPFQVDVRSQPHFVFPLDDCDDLLDSLIECAEDQVEMLAEAAKESSKEMSLPSYEDLIRSCEAENLELQDVNPAGTTEHELERAAERLTSIMAILQNLSCPDDRMQPSHQMPIYEANIQRLSDQQVIRFLCLAIRNMGTRKRLLRTQRFTLDFVKDAIMFLGNVSAQVELPGKDEAHCILHLLLSFGQSMSSGSEDSKTVVFSSQDPEQNRYLRFAVDSLAKLLARDEPNRTYFKSLLTNEASYDLLTRTFALAIAPIPDETKLNIPILQWRQSYLPQGLLAADILTTIIPSDASSLARSWLYSPDAWASNLVRVVIMLGIEHPPMVSDRNRPPTVMIDYDIHMAMVERSLNILQQLAEKAKSTDSEEQGRVKVCRLAHKSLVLRALKIEAHMQMLNHMGQAEPNLMRMYMRRVLKQLNNLMELGA